MFAEQCMPEANLEHLHTAHTVCAAVVHVPVVMKIYAQMQQRRMGNYAEN